MARKILNKIITSRTHFRVWFGSWSSEKRRRRHGSSRAVVTVRVWYLRRGARWRGILRLMELSCTQISMLRVIGHVVRGKVLDLVWCGRAISRGYILIVVAIVPRDMPIGAPIRSKQQSCGICNISVWIVAKGVEILRLIRLSRHSARIF